FRAPRRTAEGSAVACNNSRPIAECQPNATSLPAGFAPRGARVATLSCAARVESPAHQEQCFTMDDKRFDELTISLATMIGSRRLALRTAVASIAGSCGVIWRPRGAGSRLGQA